ncbi:MAG TPA: YceI family protein [Gemmatimonadaceae bacterium]
MTTATITPTNSPAATSQTWSLDTSHTEVGFAVKHLMISNVKGRFRKLTGSVEVDPNGSRTSVDISIDAASLTTGDDKRDAHLQSAEFLHVEEHPVIQFTGGRIEGNPESKFSLHGNLLIRGITRPVTLYVVNEGRVRDPWGNERVGYTASAKINRKDFGLEWNVALEAGGVLVGDEVRITIETELVKS